MSSQGTKVFVLDVSRGQELEQTLSQASYEFRSVPHARFQARGEGVTATLYRSGKLVVQGSSVDGWCLRYLGEASATNTPSAEQEGLDIPHEAIGSDEAGKGDTFGPLVVCAVGIREADVAQLRDAGVTDSKRMRDDRVRVLAPWIRDHFAHKEVVVEAEEYNHLHALHGDSVNRLLAKLHVEVLAFVHKQTNICTMVVDRFGSNMPVSRILSRDHPEFEVHEIPRAERHAAVAAASVLARDRFLESMERLSQSFAVDLPRGSGSPVQPALRHFLEIHDRDSVRRVAKLHFKNVQAVLDRLFP